MKKILLLPIDERPCNYLFPQMLVRDTEYEVVCPPYEIMPHQKQAGDCVRLLAFLEQHMATSTAVLLSLNTLLYGGLVPSRVHSDSVETVAARLESFRQLRRRYPQVKVYAYTLIMRCNRGNNDEEEPGYWLTWGSRIFRTGYLQDKKEQVGLDAAESAELDQLQAEVPAELLRDYLDRRKVNHTVNLLCLDAMRDGLFDFLAIPQDDAAEYGFMCVEQREIRRRIAENHIGTRCYLYPGADEAGSTMLARAINEDMGAHPRVYVRFNSCAAPHVQPLYEDRYIGESVKYMVLAAGGLPVYALADADMVLLINCPADAMDYAILSNRNYGVNRTLVDLVEYAAFCVEQGVPVTIGDCATTNAGDGELLDLLRQKGLPFRLAGYAGWNTSDNTLGTAIPMGMLYRLFGDRPAHRDFLALRYVEDVGYDAIVRRQVTNAYAPPAGGRSGHIPRRGIGTDFVKQHLQAFADELMADQGGHIAVEDCWFPWERTFELGLTVRFEEKP